MRSDKELATDVRTYARKAHKEYTAKLEALKAKLDTNPMHVDAEEWSNFCSARDQYDLYAGALALDAVGNSAYNDEKALDRIRDARNSHLRQLLKAKPSGSGVHGEMQKLGENAVRKFLSDTDFVDQD